MNFFFWTLLEELNPFYYVFKNWTRFSVKTPGIEPFLNRTQVFCSLNMTQKLIFFSKTTSRIEPSFYMSQWFFFTRQLKELNFFEYDSKNMNFFLNDSNNWWALFLNCLTELIFFFLKKWEENDSQDWTLFFFWKKKLSKNWKSWTLLGYHSKDWIFLQKNMTQRIEPFFFSQFDSKNCSFYFSWPKYLNLFHMTQRIEPWVKKKPQKKWNSFSNMTQRIELFFFAIWHKEFNFFQYDSKNWAFFNITLRMDPSCFPIWLWKLNSFFNMALRIEPFLFSNMIQ